MGGLRACVPPPAPLRRWGLPGASRCSRLPRSSLEAAGVRGEECWRRGAARPPPRPRGMRAPRPAACGQRTPRLLGDRAPEVRPRHIHSHRTKSELFTTGNDDESETSKSLPPASPVPLAQAAAAPNAFSTSVPRSSRPCCAPRLGPGAPQTYAPPSRLRGVMGTGASYLCRLPRDLGCSTTAVPKTGSKDDGAPRALSSEVAPAPVHAPPVRLDYPRRFELGQVPARSDAMPATTLPFY